ncbi:3-phosphoshikimate 1-carboxyvinyltransferase [Coralloluteibacterium thermophilus]|uniref:3-phosphoshikimate 1-carboxyvinyltransferase n=1 Tax=Coralloluteibacterium thermophilum TaxID=2707049 RepID=A0ABV9NJF1_9GAMM
MSARLDWIARRGTPLRGRIAVPGDKSVSHRAVMLGAVAEGITTVRGFLEGEDTRATAAVMRQLGVHIETPREGERLIYGVGLRGLRPASAPLDCGNAGTGMRLLAGLFAGHGLDCTLVGDASLSQRPMRRVVDPLRAMGARIDTRPDGTPPLRIHGGHPLRAIAYETPVASAQVKSALLLAGLYAEGTTEVREPHPTRDYTERMLAAFGWPVEFAPGIARVLGGHRLRGTEIRVPGDFSSAAFFMVAASVVPGSELVLTGVGVNPRRTGLLAALRAMGADIRESNPRESGGEPVADLTIRHAPLRGIEVPEDLVPDMIDEFPALFVAAALAEGTTVVRGAAELRVKESDRLAGMSAALRALGAEIEETPDGARIVGGRLHGGEVDSHGDHRLAMSLAIAAQCSEGEVLIRDCANVATSFPGFDALARGVGVAVGESGIGNRESGPEGM